MTNVMRNSLKLFVGNLPWTICQNDLQQYFSKFGHISNALVIFDRKTGLSKGYGFITFSTRDAYNSACNQRVHFIEGRVLTVTPAKA